MDKQRQKLKIDQVIQCLIQKQRFVTLTSDHSQNISSLYKSTKALLTQFQQHINRCKKYNQAKIHRKYQIIISDLSQQNQVLKLKVAEQHQARPSSSKYVSDLIDKMIEMRKQNQKLSRENQALQNMLSSFTEKTKILVNSNISCISNADNKQLLEKQSQKLAIKQSLNRFLSNKKAEARNKKERQKSHFQKFLLFNKHNIQKWSLLDFFQKIDKWTSHLKDLRFLDRSQIKTSLQNQIQRDDSSAIEKLPVTVKTLKQKKIYLESKFIKRNQLFDPILSSNKQKRSFRLKSLSYERNHMDSSTIE